MRVKRLACLVLIGISSAGASPLSACGDKFLALGRGMSFHQAFASVHPGAIAIYTRDPAAAAEALQPLKKILIRAGHRVTIVSADALSPVVKAAGVDIILASVNDADALRALVGNAQLQPTVLYVAPRKGAGVGRPGVTPVTPVLKPDDKAETFLRVIEDAMTVRSKAGVRVKT